MRFSRDLAMRVVNVHERTLDANPDEVGEVLDSLASDHDRLWPWRTWPRMRFDRGLTVGAVGGHDPIRYVVEERVPGRSVRFRFTAPRGFDGHHAFEVLAGPEGGTVLRHTLEMRARGNAALSWPIAFRPLHDALIEDALTRAEVSLGGTPRARPWSIRVRILRALLSLGTAPPQDPPPPRRSARARWTRRIAVALGLVIVLGFLPPSSPRIPVAGASAADWNHDTFWHHPWGRSGVHKGIDIFADAGTNVLAATGGIVLYAGTLGDGGRVVAVLGPRWRVHYYAHLASRGVAAGDVVRRGEVLGTVGSTGNARGKPPHLHYAILTLVPYPWRITAEPQGWKKMLYLDPDAALRSASDGPGQRATNAVATGGSTTPSTATVTSAVPTRSETARTA